MKPTLAKLKIILRSNVDSFVNSALIGAALYAVTYILISHLLLNMSTLRGVRGFQLTQSTLFVVVILFFTVPVIIYLMHQTSQSVIGISLKPTDTVKAKRFLFIQAGIMWASLGVLCLALFENVDYLALTASVIALLNWIAIHRTVGAYAVL